MVRHVLIRNRSGDDQIVPEAPLPAEKNLHDVLTSHPELLPADDLEVGQTIVVGRESRLESGYADLVLIDPDGQICLVEVKNEGNPDTRLVIAQLLDYAAALWQMSAEDFERAVLHPYLRSIDQHDASLPDIASYVADNLDASGDIDGGENEDDPSTLTDFAANLEQTLASGHFRLIVAAPSIPTGVEKVIEYLNAQGHVIYGLEVSFFGGPAECFVPRLVAKPRVTETRKLANARPIPIAQEDYLQSLPDRVRDAAAKFLQNAESARATIRWNSYGPSIRAARSPERVVSWLEKKRAVVTVKPFTGYPSEPFTDARKSATQLPVGTVSSDDWYWSARFEDLTDEQLDAVFSISLKLINSLVPQIDFQPLEPHLPVAFERNDNNIWAKSAPALNPYVGQWLQGTLTAIGGPNAPVRLQPIRGGQPGWQPRFDSPNTGQTIWPANLHTGKFQLVLTHAAEEAHGSP
jgi:hypothetical protein